MGTAIVTGATGGIGLATAAGLARAGHEVIVTGRDEGRGRAAVAEVRRHGKARFALLDVASLRSVSAFAAVQEAPVETLVLNAGVMALPKREETEDGFEKQLGTNMLGHFALVAHLLPLLRGARVVPVSSLAHRRGRIAFEDLNGARSYSPWKAYEQSKLAMLMFGLALHRRSAASNWGVTAAAAHPGWARSALVRNGVGRKSGGLVAEGLQLAFNALAQGTEAGALPLIHAALHGAGGEYWGPCCWGETRGRPTRSRIMPQAADEAAQDRLWAEAERMTGTRFPA